MPNREKICKFRNFKKLKQNKAKQGEMGKGGMGKSGGLLK